MRLFLLSICLSFKLIQVTAFCPIQTTSRHYSISFANKGFAKDTPKDTSNQEETPKKPKGDSLRSNNGIRPSLHPITINCIAEALLMRSKNTPDIDTNSNSEPIQIALTAGGIAMNAIEQRKASAEDDDEVFTMEECNVISGRVVGVVMRMRELECVLIEKVMGATWVGKYGEEESFGCLKCEFDPNTSDLDKELAEGIKINPLLRMNRAECLLALFLETVERPKLEMVGESVPGGSEVDFIDGDRLDVLFKE